MTIQAAATPVIVSTDIPEAGPARPVCVVNSGALLAGPVRRVVLVSDGRPRIAGPAMPVYLAANSAPTVGPAIPVYVVSGALTYAQKALNLGPLAYWPLADLGGSGARDDSGHGYAGTLSNVTLGVSGIGDDLTAMRFNGTSSVCNVYSAALAAAFNSQELTISAWLKVSAAGVWTDGTNDCPVHFGVDGASNFVRFLKASANNQFQWSYAAGGTVDSVAKSSFSPTDWFHVALTVSKAADQLRAYVNGVQEGATQTGLGVWAGALASNRCVIGGQTTTPALPWNGDIAHVGLWTRPLSAAEVAALAVPTP